MKRLLKGMIVFLLISISFSAFSQPGKFQAVFMFNFYKQMEWPASYKGGAFVIGIIGDSPVIPMLEKLMSSKTGQTKFVIARFKSVGEITKCHMLFIPSDKSDLFESVHKKLAGTSTLIITEKAGLGGKGAAINFVQINDRLKFELNQTAVRKANIQVSDMLKSLSIMI